MNLLGKLNSANSNKHQQGVVLVVSLVFLVALTAVAAALMQNSTTDMKMSGATEEKSVALQEVVSAADEVIFDELFSGNVNRFARPITDDNFPITSESLLLNTTTGSTASITAVNAGMQQSCPHLKVASSVDLFGCNILTVTTSRNYGRNNQNTITANSGIAQQVLK
ncbi:PilX N-terminal domain-containing pilus assembly protein [Colwelliaceae bacterium MEBiC 14330]